MGLTIETKLRFQILPVQCRRPLLRTFPNEKDTNHLGRVVRKPINAHPGLEVNRSIDFPCIKIFFTACVLGSSRLCKYKTEGQTIQTENLTVKLKNENLANPGLA